MRTLYLDCFAGIAGDMFLGALLDLGLDEKKFLESLESLNLSGYKIAISTSARRSITGRNVEVRLDEPDHGHHHHHEHRGLKEIFQIIDGSSLASPVKERSRTAFRLLAEAEGKIHGMPAEEVHFHEVGAVDSIVDIVGAFILLDMLSPDRIVCSSVNVGSGTVKCAHGVMPVPAPATAELLVGVPIQSMGEPCERTTPTGALIVRTIVDQYGELPQGQIVSTGYGLGDRDTELPNVLRVLLVDEESAKDSPYISGRAVVLESNIDDMNPQFFADAMEKLFDKGAFDVFFTPILMKKGRPGTRISCIAPVELQEEMARIILENTTSIGVRMRIEERVTLKREVEEMNTSFGPVRVKISRWGNEIFQVTPEYEDLKRLSREVDIPVVMLRDRIMKEIDF